MNMMFIYKLKEVNMCVSFRKHNVVTFAENDPAAYTPC